jgi:hypothetical protein
LSFVRYSKNTRERTFRKLDLFLSSGEGGDTYNHWEVAVFSYVFSISDDGQSPKTQ